MSLSNPENAPKSSIFGQKPAEIVEKPIDLASFPGGFDESFDIETLDLDRELADLYGKSKTLLNRVINAIDIPANQQAQVFNSVMALVDKLAKTRVDIYNAERLRKLEQSLIRTLQAAPKELQEAFLADYERSLSESGLS